MSVLRRIKNNLFVRNCWVLLKRILCFFKGKRQFGQCDPTVVLTPPYKLVNPKNILPAKFIKFYWSIDEIMLHEKALYAENDRFSNEELQCIFAKYSPKI